MLIVAQPTWGVDVGAPAQIRQALIDLRDGGVAVLVVSEELDELFEICDRLAVIAQGRLSPAKPIHETSAEEIGMLMAGVARAARGRRRRCRSRDETVRSKRARSRRDCAVWLAPLLATAATLVIGFVVFAALGKDPMAAFHAFFIQPVATRYGVAELLLKATPLMLIAIGLALRLSRERLEHRRRRPADVGAIAGGGVALALADAELAGRLAAAGDVRRRRARRAWLGGDSRVAAHRFNANEILRR